MTTRTPSQERNQGLLSRDKNVTPYEEPSADERIQSWLAYPEATLRSLLATNFLTVEQVGIVDTELKNRITALQKKYENPVFMTAEECLSLENWQKLRNILAAFLLPAKTR